MSNMFKKWNQQMDTEGIRNDVAEIEANKKEYKEVPCDVYEVEINKIFLDESKNTGLPLLKVWFKIVAGEYKGSMIFMNQLLVNANGKTFGLHTANEFLRQLKTSLPVTFVDWEAYAMLLEDIKEEIEQRKMTFQLKYGQAKKGDFKTFTIEQTFDNAE